jgi:HSP20 family protein
MAFRDLTLWNRGRKNTPAERDFDHPLFSLQKEMNSLFEDFFGGFGLTPSEGTFGEFQFTPRVNVSETDKMIEISAELPGIDPKDVNVSIADNSITIKGEKKAHHEEKDKHYYRVERSYGSFTRTIPLPTEVDMNNIAATFTQGVLHVSLPKVEGVPKTVKKIPIKTD